MPRLFISYSHDNPAHVAWVEDLAKIIESSGIEVYLDAWQPLGADLNHFMETPSATDKVLVICTDDYVQKANQREKGVGVETTVITGRLYNDLKSHDVIPILRRGDWNTAIPIYLRGRKGLDFRTDKTEKENLPILLSALLARPRKSPPFP